MKPRRLKGHEAEPICCIASRSRPGVIFSSGEDGSICCFDLRCKDVQFKVDVGKEPVTSICFKADNEDFIYASSATAVLCSDIRMASLGKPVETYNYNKEEINQIVFSPKSYFLAAADDSGDVKIIDTRQRCLYKTLRGFHSTICSSVQFLFWKPWSAITGGLDSKLAIWDFSKGRPYHDINFGMPEMSSKDAANSIGQSVNPALVHSIAVPEVDASAGLNKVCAVGRGDGVVDVIEIESELTGVTPRRSSRTERASKSKATAVEPLAASHKVDQVKGKRIQLDYDLGGHAAAVSCVSFSLFGEKGKFVISGGNDQFVKVWDWTKHFQPVQSSCNSNVLLNINVKRKVNWLCTTPSDAENIVVCDTSKVLKVYTMS